MKKNVKEILRASSYAFNTDIEAIKDVFNQITSQSIASSEEENIDSDTAIPYNILCQSKKEQQRSYNTLYNYDILYNAKKEIKEELQRRYKSFYLPTFTMSKKAMNEYFPRNTIIDNVIPQILMEIMYKNNSSSNSLEIALENTKTFSRFFSTAFGVTRIPILEQLKIIGYNPKDVKSLMRRVAKKNLNVASIGYGGISCGIIENLNELLKEFEIAKLFKSLTIYEKDMIEFSNIPRLNTAKTASQTADYMAYHREDYTVDNPKIALVPKRTPIAPKVKTIFKTIENINDLKYYAQDDTDVIYFGACDLFTRHMLVSNGYKYIATTHGDNTVNVIIAPEIDTELQVESYGQIELSIFNLNVLIATIEFLKALDENDDFNTFKIHYSKELSYQDCNYQFGFYKEG